MTDIIREYTLKKLRQRIHFGHVFRQIQAVDHLQSLS